MRLDASQAITSRAERLRWGNALRPASDYSKVSDPRPSCPLQCLHPARRRYGADPFAAPRLIRCNRRPSVIVGTTQLALEHKQSFLEDEQRHMALRNLLASFATQLVQR